MPVHSVTYPIRGMDNGLLVTGGTVTIAAAAIVAATTKTPGVTVTRTGAGDYRLTFSDGPQQVLSAQATLNDGVTALHPKFSTFDPSVGTTAYLDLKIVNAVPAAADPADGSSFSYLVVLKNSSVARK